MSVTRRYRGRLDFSVEALRRAWRLASVDVFELDGPPTWALPPKRTKPVQPNQHSRKPVNDAGAKGVIDA